MEPTLSREAASNSPSAYATAFHYFCYMPVNQNIDILDLISALAHQGTAAMQRSLRDAKLGLVAMEARTLRFIAYHPGCTQNDIVRESGRDKAQIARIIKVLIERGEVQKTIPAGTNRHELDVTSVGKKTHESAEALRTVVAKSMVAGLAVEERTELERILRQLTQGVAPP